MPIYIEETLAGIDALGGRVDRATHDIVSDALDHFQLAGRAEAPIGTPGNSTNPPGDLAASILIEGPAGGEGHYEGKVGPTTIYGRQRELGGAIYAKDPDVYLMHFFQFGRERFEARVYQFPDPYMHRAYDEMMPTVARIRDGVLTEAILGG